MTSEVFSTDTDTAPRAGRRSRPVTEMSRKILILGNFRQTVTVIRSLARAGFTPIIGRDGGASFTEYSRYTAEVWVHPRVGQTDAFLSALVTFLGARKDISFLFPVGETVLRCLALHPEQIPRAV